MEFRQDIQQIFDEEAKQMRELNEEVARRKKAMLEMDERGQMSQTEIDHRLQGSNLTELQIAILKANREMVNHPDHYQGNKMEVIDIIEDYNLGFSLGNAVKYILRADKKGNKKQDLEKAVWYINRELSKFKG